MLFFHRPDQSVFLANEKTIHLFRCERVDKVSLFPTDFYPFQKQKPSFSSFLIVIYRWFRFPNPVLQKDNFQ